MAYEQLGQPQFHDTSFLDHLLLEGDTHTEFLPVDDQFFTGYLNTLHDQYQQQPVFNQQVGNLCTGECWDRTSCLWDLPALPPNIPASAWQHAA